MEPQKDNPEQQSITLETNPQLYRQFTSAAIDSIKKSPRSAEGYKLPSNQQVDQYSLRFTRPAIFPARSDVIIVEAYDQSGMFTSTFVLRKEGREEGEQARKTRHFASNHAKAAAVCSKFLPTVYQEDKENNWTAVERVCGIEEKEIQVMFDNEQFVRDYSESAFNLLKEVSDAGLLLDDVNFVNGHNCKFHPRTKKLKLIEPDLLIPNTIGKEFRDIIAKKISIELDYGNDYPFVFENFAGEFSLPEKTEDHSSKRKFLYQFMRQIMRINEWENLSTQLNSLEEYIEYLAQTEGKRDEHFSARQKRAEALQKTHELRMFLSPEIIQILKDNNFGAFDKVVGDYRRFCIISTIPKK